ncbi:B12-binding domain-containing radical SAM protein [Clostridium sp. D2Q-11]|uniref:B12-binding domain-containing radical SAM protein n=1 Tax=Anaeromonas frigoriresistens TaxID=2683708 RepID=A0A942Z8I9_9FIRM|nr:B12-binding domain-containing radical SAM protein [Anaeromonas frigoriresistens]MBS4537965.1 B12-binding domain-containing radical SAM protein [Anaeromonas frigoriresistens]
MKILLTTLNSKFVHSSLSIRYLKECIKDLNIEVEIEEYTINQQIDFIVSEIYKKDIDIVAFATYIWNIEEVMDICDRLKLIKPELKILLGGPEVSFDIEEIMKNNKNIDFIIYGEGEDTFREFTMNTIDNKGYWNIRGLAYRNNNDIVINNPRKLINNLDKIPSPFKEDVQSFRNKIVYYETSRGCPFNCKFCLSSTIEGVRFFSINRVKEDLKFLIESNVKQVKFVDRTFNTNKKYAMEIMNYIANNNPNNINFHFEVTAHLLDDEMLKFLENVKEGMFQFEIGVQSTNEKTIEAIGRTTDFKKLSKVVNRINSYKNIHQHLDLIVGLPYEDYNTFKISFNDVYNLEPEKLQLGFLKLLKGSELRNNEELHGFKYIDKPPYEIMENDYITYEEILKLKTIEDLVEKYGNELNFKHTLKFIIKNYFKSAFDFYEDFAEYWEEFNYHTMSHSLNKLYKIIYDYYNDRISKDLDIFNDIIKYDYIFNNNSLTPKYMNVYDEEKIKKYRHDFLQDEKNIIKYLPNYEKIPVKKIIKDISIIKFKFDILKFFETNERENIIWGEKFIMFVHKGKNKVFTKSEVIDITEDFYKEEE